MLVALCSINVSNANISGFELMPGEDCPSPSPLMGSGHESQNDLELPDV